MPFIGSIGFELSWNLVNVAFSRAGYVAEYEARSIGADFVY